LIYVSYNLKAFSFKLNLSSVPYFLVLANNLAAMTTWMTTIEERPL